MAHHQSSSQREYVVDIDQSEKPIESAHLRLGGTSPRGDTVAFTNYYMTYNDRPLIPVMGEFHFARFPRRFWEEELRKMAAGGITIVSTYLFWIYVEEDEGVFDWSGDNDVRFFVELCQALGLQVILRIGPFAHGECRNGGFPDWLYGRSFPVRSNHPSYIAYVRRYFTEIEQQVSGLFFKDNGPIIGIQLENEYMHTGAPWEVTYRPGKEWVPVGSDGEAHMLLLKQTAREVGFDVPLYSCTAWIGSPVPAGEFLPMQGGYAYTPWNPDPDFRQEPTLEFLFRNRHAQPLATGDATYEPTLYPYACCELGSGIQITYHHRPIVPPECTQAMAVVAVGSGANLLGYYMYHGGSNPIGKHAFLNEFTVPRISYDFQSPIREYGQLNESYHRLRTIHLFLRAFGDLLAPMSVSLPAEAAGMAPTDVETLRYSVRSKDGSGFVFLNNFQDHSERKSLEGLRLRLNLADESICIPRQQELTVEAGVSAILPFNLHLAGDVVLKYATAQLLTQLQASEQTTYVFFAPSGMSTEFALERASYQTIDVSHGTFTEEQGQTYITLEPGLHTSIQLTTSSGASVRLLVLTQEQAHHCWQMEFAGQERLLISDAFIHPTASGLKLTWRDLTAQSLAIYPPLEQSYTLTLAGAQLTSRGGELFTKYTVEVAGWATELPEPEIASDSLSVPLTAEMLKGVHDLFLKLDYIGDIGNAYIDGRLVNDHFANGLPWEIGLRRFVPEQGEQELVMRLSPLQTDSSVMRYLPTGMAFRPSADGTTPIEIRSLSFSPEYSIHLELHKERVI